MTVRRLIIEFDSPTADEDCRQLRESLMHAEWNKLVGTDFFMTYKPQKDGNYIRFIPRNAFYQLVDLVTGAILATRAMSPVDAAGANESLCRELHGTRRWRTIVPDYLADSVHIEAEDPFGLFYVFHGPVLIGNLRINATKVSWMAVPQPGGFDHIGSAEECVAWLTGTYLAYDKMKWPKD